MQCQSKVITGAPLSENPGRGDQQCSDCGGELGKPLMLELYGVLLLPYCYERSLSNLILHGKGTTNSCHVPRTLADSAHRDWGVRLLSSCRSPKTRPWRSLRSGVEPCPGIVVGTSKRGLWSQSRGQYREPSLHMSRASLTRPGWREVVKRGKANKMAAAADVI